MKTITVTRYVADDGREFNDPDECKKYEQQRLVVQAINVLLSEHYWDQIGVEDIAKVVTEYCYVERRIPEKESAL